MARRSIVDTAMDHQNSVSQSVNVHGLGVDVFVAQNSDVEVPYCAHGPTLLFERFAQGGSSKRFYACSACRDRKECPFFMLEGDKFTQGKQLIQEHTKKELKERAQSLPYDKVKKMPVDEESRFCTVCDLLYSTNETSLHNQHDYIRLKKEEMKYPTRILPALVNKRSNAQYLFSNSSCQFLSRLLINAGYRKVLCVGTPKLHETIKQLGKENKKLKSFLLDIDDRFAQFNPMKLFAWYNMFNNYFFDANSKGCLMDFLKGVREELVIVVDPPFGGLMSVLAQTLQSLWKIWRDVNLFDEESTLSTVLAFPYFLESHVKNSLPSLVMMDYKVMYTNHKAYKAKGKGNRRGSPIRFFTNIKASDFALPMEEGYHYCSVCHRYISEENKHCNKCNSCTSKDGTTYVHCDLCKCCVKPGRKHCNICNKCEHPNHSCNDTTLSSGCHICGKVGHKRKDCKFRVKDQQNNSKRKVKETDSTHEVKKIKRTK